LGGIIGELHHVVEVSLGIVSPYVQNMNQAAGCAGDWFETLNAGKLTLEWPLAVEVPPPDDFYSAQRAHDIAGKPHLAVSSAADRPKQGVVGYRGRRAHGVAYNNEQAK
jgi:hypothetical protein